MLKQVATTTSNNLLHIENNTPTKAHTLLHVDPNQSFAYTANSSSDGQVMNSAAHFINEQTPILTMVSNSKGYAINTLPPKQANIYIQGMESGVFLQTTKYLSKTKQLNKPMLMPGNYKYYTVFTLATLYYLITDIN